MTGRRRHANGKFAAAIPNEWDAETLAELRAVDPDAPAAEPAESPQQAELAEAYKDYDATVQAGRAAHRAAVDAAWNTLWVIEQEAADAYANKVLDIRARYRYTPVPAIENVTPPAQD